MIYIILRLSEVTIRDSFQPHGSSVVFGFLSPVIYIIPLYPAFLAFLSNQDDDAPSVAVLGVLVALGVIDFMAAVGVLFTTLLKTSLTAVVELVSPPAFGLLAVLGAVLVANLHPQARLPTIEPPQTRFPSLPAFAYGAFFGAIVLACNLGFISVFFARAFLFSDPVTSLANFSAFGVGMASPLLAFAFVSERWRYRMLDFLTGHRRAINSITGVVLLVISLHYLFLYSKSQDRSVNAAI